MTGSFKQDDKVRWVSSNTPKYGVVTHVVPAGSIPDSSILKGVGMPRDHETYVVRGFKVGRNGEKIGPSANYWPRVSLLEALQ